MKNISFLLVFLILLQSCTVYNNVPTSVEAAVASGEKAKVITTDNQSYRFKQLENTNNRLTGITTLRSITAKKLAGTSAKIEGKYLAYDLSALDIREIRLWDETDSILASAAAIVGFLGAAFITFFLISFASSDWSFGEGSN